MVLGATNFQLKLTKKGPVIFEINPRFSGTTHIRSLFGLNEIDIILNKGWIVACYSVDTTHVISLILF